ncbi:NADH-quinone oxidoreductase subunit NuoK [Acetonema longum]|uniref:NADH-quinone oxidoreductase subunit K n=1 Tax=Acetonema longum DSM 6540 TaxID=1009370 RepID=F7NDE6_9FIRM|nr:NADH-quinone oxidoreductase subunit NuoK [Acetonema longum]EGO65978.1 NADH-ubiquinone oxidoreductase chain 4L [Acetonema longum DSM 6540]
MIGLEHYLVVSACLFSLGLYGLFTKRNAVAVLMCIELMLNAVNLNFVAFSRFITPGGFTGQIFAIFNIAVAAAEVAVGLALIFAIYRDRATTNVDELDWMKW